MPDTPEREGYLNNLLEIHCWLICANFLHFIYAGEIYWKWACIQLNQLKDPAGFKQLGEVPVTKHQELTYS